MMNSQEMETEISTLRAELRVLQDENAWRQKTWRSVRRGCGLLGTIFIVGAIVIGGTSYFLSGSRHVDIETSVMFAMLSLPFSFLASALAPRPTGALLARLKPSDLGN